MSWSNGKELERRRDIYYRFTYKPVNMAKSDVDDPQL